MMSEKCSKEYDDSMAREGEKAAAKQNFQVTIPEEEMPAPKKIIRKKKALPEETKSEKSARYVLVILTCLMAVITVGVVITGGFSDVFKQGVEEKATSLQDSFQAQPYLPEGE